MAFLRMKALLDAQLQQCTAVMYHGRDSVEEQSLIAPLMVQLPLRVQLSGDSDADADLCEGARQLRLAQSNHLFDPAQLEAQGITAAMPSVLFGYYQLRSFVGRIADAPFEQLPLPDVTDKPQPWRLTCEVMEHGDHFTVDIEAARYPAALPVADLGSLFLDALQGVVTAYRQTDPSVLA